MVFIFVFSYKTGAILCLGYIFEQVMGKKLETQNMTEKAYFSLGASESLLALSQGISDLWPNILRDQLCLE